MTTKSIKPIQSTIFLSSVSETEIMNTINSLKIKSSVGYNGISTKIIKSAVVVLAPVLKHTGHSLLLTVTHYRYLPR